MEISGTISQLQYIQTVIKTCYKTDCIDYIFIRSTQQPLSPYSLHDIYMIILLKPYMHVEAVT